MSWQYLSTRQAKAQKAAPAPTGDAHSNLMEAIRNAGGAGRAKLRPAADDTSAKVSVYLVLVLLNVQ